MKLDKQLYWSIKGTLFVVGIVILFSVVPKLISMLTLLVDLFKLTNTTPEFKIILVCISIWVNCVVINTVVNFVFKLQDMLKTEYKKVNKRK